MTKGSSFILRLYFAVVSAVTLFTLMYGLIDLVTIGLKTYVFTAADVPTYIESCDGAIPSKPDSAISASDNETSEEQRVACEARNATQIENYERQKADSAVRNLALMIVSLPLFLIHFRIVYRDWKEDHKA